MMKFKDFFEQKKQENEAEWEMIEDTIIQSDKEKKKAEFTQWVKEEYEKFKEAETGIEKKAVLSCPLKKKYVKIFDKASFNNNVAAQSTFYTIMSLVCKTGVGNRKYYIKRATGGKIPVNPIVHMFWSQDSTSGKSEGLNFVFTLAKSISDVLYKLLKRDDDDEVFRILDTMWTETPETYINRFKEYINKKGQKVLDYETVIKGYFEECDLILSHECSFLFEEKRGDKQTISEMLLTMLEGKTMEKKLVSWNGNMTITTPNFVFLGATRPVERMSSAFMEKGLFQRTISYFRNISSAQRDSMDEQIIKGKVELNDKEIEGLAKDFADVYQWRTQQKIKELTIEDYDFYLKSKRDTCSMVRRSLERNLKDWKKRNTLQSFVIRYFSSLADSLFVLTALADKRTVIKKSDIIECLSLLKDIFLELVVFIEYNVPTSKAMMALMKKTRRMLHSMAKTGQSFTEKEMLRIISKKMSKTMSASQKILDEILADGLIKKHKGKYYIMVESADVDIS